jgi:hypothetical protein
MPKIQKRRGVTPQNPPHFFGHNGPVMRPAPLSKTLRSPDFKAANITIHGFARKDGNLRLVEAGWEDAKVVQPDEVVSCGAQAGLKVGGGSARKRCPPVKIETP